MGIRIRKSKNIGPFRVNFSKSGIGYSVGGKGFRYTKTAKGNTRKTYSIPGSGISYVEESSNNKKTSNNGKKKKTISVILGVILFFAMVSFLGDSKEDKKEISSIQINSPSQTMDLNETLSLDVILEPGDAKDEDIKTIVKGNNLISVNYENNKLTINSYLVDGEASVYLQYNDIKSNEIDIKIIDSSVDENNQNEEEHQEQNSSESNHNSSQSANNSG